MAVLARLPEFKSPLCRLSFAGGLFEAKQIQGSKDFKYSATLIFPIADRPTLESMVIKLILETPNWGAARLERMKAEMQKPVEDRIKKDLIKLPIISGTGAQAKDDDGKLKPGMGPDVFFIRVQSGVKNPPKIIWRDPKTDETETNVYSGCYGKAQLNLFSWNNVQQGDGISFGISGFQKHREGERLGSGRSNPETWAETIEDDGPAPESTRTGQGAAGLFGSD